MSGATTAETPFTRLRVHAVVMRRIEETMVQYKYWMVHSPAGGAAQKTHQTLNDAMDEAKRLATQQPGKRFAVLEVVSCYEVRQPEPTVVRVEHMPQVAEPSA